MEPTAPLLNFKLAMTWVSISIPSTWPFAGPASATRFSAGLLLIALTVVTGPSSESKAIT